MHARRSPFVPIAATLLTLAFSFALTACGAASAPTPTPSPSARPTPTPITVTVSSPADAAAIVIASDPRFAGVTELRPDVIGASKWWKAEALAGGGYRVEVTIGWGDCQAGCIERHVWTFDVDGNGGLTLVSETGDPLPSDQPA
jgi:hypothetical protein